jgi:hypothetical protein
MGQLSAIFRNRAKALPVSGGQRRPTNSTGITKIAPITVSASAPMNNFMTIPWVTLLGGLRVRRRRTGEPHRRKVERMRLDGARADQQRRS